MSTNRLESFSDGVLAVAITLLALNIAVPAAGGHHSLGHELAAQWPVYAAYVTSFTTIGIIWINHHVMIGRLRETSHAILILNLILLMSIGVLPFTTDLMARYLKHSQGQHLAAEIYSGSFLLMSIAFSLVNRQILIRSPQLLGVELSPERRRAIFTGALRGVAPYVLAIAAAPLSAYATLAICLAVAAYYALPIASGGDAAGPWAAQPSDRDP